MNYLYSFTTLHWNSVTEYEPNQNQVLEHKFLIESFELFTVVWLSNPPCWPILSHRLPEPVSQFLSTNKFSDFRLPLLCSWGFRSSGMLGVVCGCWGRGVGPSFQEPQTARSLENATDRLSRNVGNQIPTYAVYHSRRADIVVFCRNEIYVLKRNFLWNSSKRPEQNGFLWLYLFRHIAIWPEQRRSYIDGGWVVWSQRSSGSKGQRNEKSKWKWFSAPNRF